MILQRRFSLALVLGFALTLVAVVPAGAEYSNAPPCASAPATVPVLISPRDGTTGVGLERNWIELGIIPSSMPPLDEQRIVLVDSTPYATDGGTLQLDTTGFPWERYAPAVTPSMSFAKTWVPALTPNRQYTIRIQLPNQNNCVYATLGSFTTIAQ